LKEQIDGRDTSRHPGQTAGVFGSAFNPPTRGHLDALRQMAARFDSILLVPCAAHPFGKICLQTETRIRLLEAFCEDAVDLPCALIISRIESQLLAEHPKRPVYTWTLLDALSRMHPETAFAFIRGQDNALPDVWNKFYRYTDIEKRWAVLTATERLPVHSSEVRNLLHKKPVDTCRLNTLVTPSVQTMLLTDALYQESSEIAG